MINSRWSIVAYGAAALLGVLMVALALVELGDDSRTPPRASVVAFAVHDEVTGAYVQAQILDVDPNDPSADLSMYLRFTFGTSELPAAGRSVTPIHTVTAESEAVSPNAGSLVTSAPVAAGGERRERERLVRSTPEPRSPGSSHRRPKARPSSWLARSPGA